MILKIKNRKIDFFNNFTLNLKYDSVASSFAFNYYFDPNNKDIVELAHVGHYHKMSLEHNDELLLTGYILSQTFNDGPVKQLSGIAGYSLPGVLEDCEIPTTLYPLQSDGLSLRQIAQKLISPFGIKMIVDPEVSAKMNSVYDTSTASETQTIKGYLTELASQKDIVVSHNEKGELLFTSAKTTKKPLLEFSRAVPGTSMSLSFNGQAMHSHITIQKQAGSDGGNAGESTIRNPFVPFVFRSKVKSQSSGDDNNTGEAAKCALAEELKNIKLVITTDRWEIDGKIIKPNNLISAINPEIYLFKKTNWFIESVNFEGDNTKTIATLTCVLPEVYNGKIPINIFEH